MIRIERFLRYEDNVRLAGNAGPQRQVSRMTSHHFDNLHPAMRAGGRARALNHFRHVAQRGIKSKCVVGFGEVLVDCLWNSDYPHSEFGKSCGHAQGILATANHHRIEPKFFNILDYFSGSILRSSVCG